jgi:segregation and condensation protein A
MALSVKLTAFEGPLDLLLHLIEKNKIDIYDIPIVEITDQYLEYVQKMDIQDMDLASEFMVMAATLLDIKCRMLLPKEEEESEDEEDPRDELVKRLIEFKKYKYMSGILRDAMDDAGISITKEMSLPEEVVKYRPSVDIDELLEGVTLEQLNSIYMDVMRRRRDSIDPVRSRFSRIEKEKISVADQMIQLEKKAIRDRKITFRSCLEDQPDRVSVVVTFLAVLELMHYGKIKISQDSLFGEITIESLEDSNTVVDENAFAGSVEFA